MITSKQIPTVVDVLLGRIPVKHAANLLQYSVSDVRHLVFSITKNNPISTRNDFLIYKDNQSIYRAVNQNAEKIGEIYHAGRLIGKTECEVNPSYAQTYINLEQKAIATKNIVYGFENVNYNKLGLLKTKAILFPVINFHGEVEGVLVKCNLALSLSEQGLGNIFKHLQNGFAKYFIRSPIQISHQNKIFVLTQKEAELLLYYCFGYSSKRIAYIIQASYRTVDGKLSQLKQYFGLESTWALKSLLIQNDFFENF